MENSTLEQVQGIEQELTKLYVQKAQSDERIMALTNLLQGVALGQQIAADAAQAEAMTAKKPTTDK